MADIFKCPHCGGENEYPGEGDTLRCVYCGSAVPVPEKMVTDVAAKKLGSKARAWIIVFVIVVFVIPTCLAFGGTLLGLFGGLIGTLVAIFGSLFR